MLLEVGPCSRLGTLGIGTWWGAGDLRLSLKFTISRFLVSAGGVRCFRPQTSSARGRRIADVVQRATPRREARRLRHDADRPCQVRGGGQAVPRQGLDPCGRRPRPGWSAVHAEDAGRPSVGWRHGLSRPRRRRDNTSQGGPGARHLRLEARPGRHSASVAALLAPVGEHVSRGPP